MDHFVWVDGLKVRSDSEALKFSFVDLGNFFNLNAVGFRDSSVDEVAVENCELRLDDGIIFEDICRKSAR